MQTRPKNKCINKLSQHILFQKPYCVQYVIFNWPDISKKQLKNYITNK